MAKTRVILELGSGNDLHDSDYTKAALRAVQDALHHSSLSFIRSLNVDRTKLDVEVTIGVQHPEQVDLEKVKRSLPIGNVTVTAVKGGLDVADPDNNDRAVIASAAIAVRIEAADGHAWVPRLVEALPGQIRAITLGKPTLEDVFIARCGRRME